MGYCSLDDVYLLAGSARAFVIVPRPWDPSARMGDAIDITTGTIRMAGHGYTSADLVDPVLIGAGSLPGGMPAGTLLSPLPIPGDSFRFRLATSPGGPPLTYTSPGSGWSLQIDHTRRLQRNIDEAAARIDEKLTANAPPINVLASTGKYPDVIVGINARMAYRAAIPTLQFENAAFRTAADRVLAMEAADALMLATWLEGKPVNVRPTDQTTGVNENAARFGRGRARRGFDERTLR